MDRSLESVLSDPDLSREIAERVRLLQQRPDQHNGGTAGASGGGVESTTGAREVPAGDSGTAGPLALIVTAEPVAPRSSGPNGARARAAAAAGGVESAVAETEFAVVKAGEAELQEALRTVVAENGANEAIVRRFGRPALIVRNDTFEVPASDTWRALLFANKSRLDTAIRSVGRVELVGMMPPYIGTAWMVGPDIAVTNRHVAAEFARRTADGWGFRTSPGGTRFRVRVDFREEYLQTTPFEAEVAEILFVADEADDQPDVALLRLSRPADGRPLPPPLPLLGEQPSAPYGRPRKVAVIGYPAEDPRNGEADQSRIFANIFDVKRLAPGEARGADSSFVFTHDCSTLGGNSGSPVVDIETGAVVGLHFAGEYLVNNYAVRSTTVRDLLTRIEVGVELAPPAAPKELGFREATAEEVLDRNGYDAGFLGDGDFRVPLPSLATHLAERAVVVDEGRPEGHPTRFELRYTHFSIAMHQDRRMAIYTASNIDGEQSRQLKRKKDVWAFDPRISRDYQIGNELYAGNDLDRGHLVRRLDPAWGELAEAKRAEVDTFYFTNCTPQHSTFNQQLWLSLEDYLLGNIDTRNFRACIFTGPVFSNDDRLYRDELLPLAYWKVAVMVHDQKNSLTATAYMVSQRDLVSKVEFVFGQFETYQVPITAVEQLTHLDFGRLKTFDPLAKIEGGAVRRLRGPDDLVL